MDRTSNRLKHVSIISWFPANLEIGENLERIFIFSSQGKSREFDKYASNEGQIREFDLRKRESHHIFILMFTQAYGEKSMAVREAITCLCYEGFYNFSKVYLPTNFALNISKKKRKKST